MMLHLVPFDPDPDLVLMVYWSDTRENVTLDSVFDYGVEIPLTDGTDYRERSKK